ncbi:coil containing protein [Vibrio phage 1.244.A._10N.261.54.C3]|nr:coil containing protein [Vibrio phage 1.244.A._10N.261.54.C3]AUR98836.1 TMhelix containing protein [Vibrio phage 1.255.O._10N.286.45.F1]
MTETNKQLGVSSHMGWIIPLVAVVLSLGATMGTNKFNEGNDQARLDSFEQKLGTLSDNYDRVESTYVLISNQLTAFSGKLDVLNNDMGYIKRDFGDLKGQVSNSAKDMAELKLFVLTEGKQGNLETK